MFFKVIVSDRDFTIVDEIQDKISDLRWEYNRIGGCGSFSFRVLERYCRNFTICPSFNIKIYCKNTSTNVFDLWYQGKVDSVQPNINGMEETLSINGSGYQSQLQDIYVDRDYSSQEISVVVKSILDNDIIPNQDITYSASDIEATTFTPNTLTFNCDALEALRTLADITGTREWGVDKDRKFFFKERSETVGLMFPLGDKVLNFSGDDSSVDTTNRVIIIGGGDPPFTAIYNNSSSQAKWNRRDKVIQNSAITTTQVASQFADSIFAEFSDVVRRARVDLLYSQRIEATLPLPLIRIIPKMIRYNDLKYNDFLYAGHINYQISKIQYSIDISGNIKASLQIGQLRPSVSEEIARVDHEISQMRAQPL